MTTAILTACDMATLPITEARVALAGERDGHDGRLLGYASFTIGGCFVVRDVRLVRGSRGPVVAMPSRKIQDRCPSCDRKNDLAASFCSSCGDQLDDPSGRIRHHEQTGRPFLHADHCFPANAAMRAAIVAAILDAYREAVAAAEAARVGDLDGTRRVRNVPA